MTSLLIIVFTLALMYLSPWFEKQLSDRVPDEHNKHIWFTVISILVCFTGPYIGIIIVAGELWTYLTDNYNF